jgi:hypothetical protein
MGYGFQFAMSVKWEGSPVPNLSLKACSAPLGDAGHGLWHFQWLAGLDDAGPLGGPVDEIRMK